MTAVGINRAAPAVLFPFAAPLELWILNDSRLRLIFFSLVFFVFSFCLAVEDPGNEGPE